MTISTTAVTARPETAAPEQERAGTGWRRPEALVAALVAIVALALALSTQGRHVAALSHVARGTVASLVLFLACGYAPARALVPASWGALRPLLALPLGVAVSALLLTALGLLHVPLQASWPLVLVAGVAAGVLVRRRSGRWAPRLDRVELCSWLATLLVVFCVALIPAWRTGIDTIYGENPDAHQVVGIAVLFQHVPPTATDDSLPIDTVPPSWRFRYPIFYPLAAASDVSHLDPIAVFPAMAALLLAVSVLGFGAIAVRNLGANGYAGLIAAGALGLSWVPLYLVWHPYWNQLWGLAMLPYGLLFGWQALTRRDGRAAVLCVLMLATLWLAYPLALPYPLLLLAALAIAHRRAPRLPAIRRSRELAFGILAAIVLVPAVAGAAIKLEQGIGQLFSSGSSMWGGDIKQFMPFGRFVGGGGGVIPAVLVAALALLGLLGLPRRVRIALGTALALLCLLDLRFRLSGNNGAYMDFKHLSFVGALLLTLAVAGLCRLLARRSVPQIALALALASAWVASALVGAHRLVLRTPLQVTPQLLQIRSWAGALPHGASVRLDIPPSGLQLWAIYMLGDHPVDSPSPVVGTTYAHARYGGRARYALALQPYPPRDHAVNPPVFSNVQFVLRRVDWPARLAGYPDTSSTALVEP